MSNLKPTLVSDIIHRYETTKNPDLATLLEDAKVLAAQSYWYADALGELGKNFRMAYVFRKAKYSELFCQFVDEGNSAAAARERAGHHIDFVTADKNEKELEGRYKHGKDLFEAISRVLDRMNQEIAELRKERDYQRHTGAVTAQH